MKHPEREREREGEREREIEREREFTVQGQDIHLQCKGNYNIGYFDTTSTVVVWS